MTAPALSDVSHGQSVNEPLIVARAQRRMAMFIPSEYNPAAANAENRGSGSPLDGEDEGRGCRDRPVNPVARALSDTTQGSAPSPVHDKLPRGARKRSWLRRLTSCCTASNHDW
jgi:hypothetical protein